MSAPKWSTTPPTEPGFWFWRVAGDPPTGPRVAHLDYFGRRCDSRLFDDDKGEPLEFCDLIEWWPVPIPEPPREEGDR